MSVPIPQTTVDHVMLPEDKFTVSVTVFFEVSITAGLLVTLECRILLSIIFVMGEVIP